MLRPTLQDLGFGLRTLKSAPWFSLVTVLTLALGIGASVAMFSVLHAVFLRPLPFPEADRLVVGRTTVQGHLNPWATGADYYDYRDQAQGFSELAAVLPFPVDLTVSGGGEAERVSGNVASPNLFAALQAPTALGRPFLPEEGLEGAGDVVLLSHGFWQRRLGGDPGAVGSTITLDGSPYTVVGILPPDFFFMARAELWLPMRPDRYAAASRDMHNWYMVGRLESGWTLDEVQAGVDVVAARLREAYPETNRDKGLLLTGLREVLTEDYRDDLWILTGAALLVLLIACGNGAGILLARAPARRFELSVRGALGAPRGRLVRQLLAESLGLALAGGVVGTLLAIWFQGVMLRYLDMERMGLGEVGLSFPVLGAALGVALVSGLLAGIYPAVRSAGASVTDGLRTGGRGSGDAGAGFRSGLVVSQVALSVVLLAASGLLVRSLSMLRALDPGFEPGGVLTGEVQLPSGRYPDPEARNRYLSTLLGELRAMPGVESATLTSQLPIGDFGNIYRARAEGSEEERQRVFLRSLYPGYFETLGIPLLAGKGFRDEGQVDGPWVVVISQTAARRLFPGEDPLGKVVEFQAVPRPRLLEVVGVVGDVRLSRLEEEPEAALYVPYLHHPRSVMRIALKARVEPESMAGALTDVVRGLDPDVPLSRVATLEGLVSGSLAERRAVTLGLTLLALLPLLLASVGLFAVLAYHVSQRRHEMGIRLALGARPAHVGGLVLGQGFRLVVVGLALGLGGSVAGTRVLQGLLFGVGATDPATFLSVAGLVLGVAAVACAVPVLRAIRADPRVALEAE
jgi:predicted permease